MLNIRLKTTLLTILFILRQVNSLLLYQENLLAYYPLYTDATDNFSTNNGVLSNTISVQNRFGENNQAQEFSSTSSFFQFPNSVLQNQKEFSIVFWFKQTCTGCSKTLFHAYTSQTKQLVLNTDSIQIGQNVVNLSDFQQKIDDQNWHQISFVHVFDYIILLYLDDQIIYNLNYNTEDITDQTLYIFGQFSNQDTVTPTTDFDSNQFLEGHISDIKIYDTYLTSRKIKQLYDSDKSICPYQCNSCDTITKQCLDCKGDRIFFDGQCLCPKNSFDDYKSTNCQLLSSISLPNPIFYYPFDNQFDTIDPNQFVFSNATNITNRNNEPRKAYYVRWETTPLAFDYTYIQLPTTTANLINGLSSYTISLWFYKKIEISESYGSRTLISFATNGFDNHMLFTLNGMYVNYQASNQYTAFYEILLNLEKWNQLILAVENDSYTIYLNGVSIGTYLKAQLALNVDENGFIIGQEQDVIGGQFSEHESFNGYLSDLRFYSSTFTSEQAKTLYDYEYRYCPFKCAKCDQETNKCLECVGNRFLKDGDCICPLNTIEDDISTTCPDLQTTIQNLESNLNNHYPLHNSGEDIINGQDMTHVSNSLQIEENRFQESSKAFGFQGSTDQYCQIPNQTVNDKDELTLDLWATQNQDQLKFQVLFSVARQPTGTITQTQGANWFILSSRELIIYTGENVYGYYMIFYELLKDLGINQWHHLTVTLYYSQINLYLDGLLYYSEYIDQYQYRMYANAIIVGQEQDDIGGGFESQEAWDGKISDIRIFNTALNAQQVKMLHLYTSTYEFTEYPCAIDFCSGCYYNTQLCASCVSGDRILNDLYECVCPDGTLDNSQATCPTCDIQCENCEETTSKCTSCQGLYRSTAPDCDCQAGYFSVLNQADCDQCSYQCATCEKYGECTSCKGAYRSVTPQCECDEGYYNIGQQEDCEPCKYNCLSCINSADNCTQCKGQNRSNNWPDCLCLEGYYDDGTNSPDCLPCGDSNCKKCLVSDPNYCMESFDGYFTSNGQVFDCSQGQAITQILSLNEVQIKLQFVGILIDSSYVSTQNQFTYQLCQYLFDTQQLSQFGQNPTCKMESTSISTTINIVFNEYTVTYQEFDEISINQVIYQDTCDLNFPVLNYSHTYQNANYATIPVPEIELTRIQQVSLCQNIQVSILSQKYDGFHSLQNINWEIIGSNPASSTQHLSDMNALINQYDDQTYFQLNKYTLNALTTYVFKVTFSNYLGKQNSKTFEVDVLSDKTAVFNLMDQKSILQIKPNQYNYIYFQLYLIECNENSEEFQINYTNLDYYVNQMTDSTYQNIDFVLENQSVIQENQGQGSFIISPYMLQAGNSYYVQFLPNFMLNGHNLAMSSELEIQVQKMGYLVYIKGGNRMQSYSQITRLNGIYQNQNVEYSQQQDGFQLNWECQNIVTSGPCKNTNNQVVTINQDEDYLQFEPKLFEPYSTLNFTFIATINSEVIQDSAIIIFVELDSPTLSVSLPDNIFSTKINMNDDIYVNVQYGNEVNNDGENAVQSENQVQSQTSGLQYHLILQYNLEKVAIKTYQYNEFSFKVWNLFSDFKDDNYEITAKISFYDPLYTMPSYSTFTLKLNQPPKIGQLEIYPITGYSSYTEFTISAKNFGTGTKQLYEFYYYLSQEDYNQEKALGNQSTNLKRQLLSSFQEDISEIKTYLPRQSQINNNLTILVLVKDQNNALSNSTQSVQIELKTNLEEQLQNIITIFNEAQNEFKTQQNWQAVNKYCILAQDLNLGYELLISQKKYQTTVQEMYQALLNVQNHFIIKTRKQQIQKSLNILLEILKNLGDKSSVNIDSNLQNLNDDIESQLNQIEQFQSNGQLNNCNSEVDQQIEESRNFLGKSIESINNLIDIQQIQPDLSNNQQQLSLISSIEKIASVYNQISLPNSDPVIYSGASIVTSMQKQTYQYFSSFFDNNFIYTTEQDDTNNNNINNRRFLNALSNNDILDIQYSYYKKNLLMQNDFPYKNQSNPIQYYQINKTDTKDQVEIQQQISQKFVDYDLNEKTMCISTKDKQGKWDADSCNLYNSNGKPECICEGLQITTLIDDIDGVFSSALSEITNTFNSDSLNALAEFEYYKSSLFYIILIIIILNIYVVIIGFKKDKQEASVMAKVNQEQAIIKKKEKKLNIKNLNVKVQNQFLNVEQEEEQEEQDESQNNKENKLKTPSNDSGHTLLQKQIQKANDKNFKITESFIQINQFYNNLNVQLKEDNINNQITSYGEVSQKFDVSPVRLENNDGSSYDNLKLNSQRNSQLVSAQNVQKIDNQIINKSQNAHKNDQISFKKPNINSKSQPKIRAKRSIKNFKNNFNLKNYDLDSNTSTNRLNSQKTFYNVQSNQSQNNSFSATNSPCFIDHNFQKQQDNNNLQDQIVLLQKENKSKIESQNQIQNIEEQNISKQTQNSKIQVKNQEQENNQKVNIEDQNNFDQLEYVSISEHEYKDCKNSDKKGIIIDSACTKEYQNKEKQKDQKQILKENQNSKNEEQIKNQENNFKNNGKKLKIISIWNTFLIFHQFFCIYFVYSLKKSRPVRFSIFFLKQYLSLGISSLYKDWTSTQLEAIIFNIFILFITSFPVLLVQIVIVRKQKPLKIIGIIIYCLIVLLSFWIIFVSASSMGLTQSNEWTISYVSAFFFDFSASQSLVSAGKNWALNKYGRDHSLISKLLDEEMINYYYFTYG